MVLVAVIVGGTLVIVGLAMLARCLMLPGRVTSANANRRSIGRSSARRLRYWPARRTTVVRQRCWTWAGCSMRARTRTVMARGIARKSFSTEGLKTILNVAILGGQP